MIRFKWPLVWSGVCLAGWVLLRLLAPAWAGPEELAYLLAAFFAGVSVVVVRGLNFFLFDVFFKARKGREAPAILRFLASVVAYTFAALFILGGLLGKDLSGVLTTSAVVTVVFGLALQDTLGNFFSGISIHVEQPFHIGDAIQLRDTLGRVEAVTWRTTAIRTQDNTIVVFPNNLVAREPLEIFRFNGLNRRVLVVPAPYGRRPEQVISLLAETARSLPQVASDPPPRARLRHFGDSGIDYEVLYWIRDYMLAPEVDAQIRERAWYAFKRNDIDIPFPVRHLVFDPVADAEDDLEAPDYRPILGRVELFSPLRHDERERIASAALTRLFAPGEVLLRRGEPGDSMFVIARGEAEVLVPDQQGAPRQVAVLTPGDFVGEMALFTGEARSADVRALSEVAVLEIRKPVMEALFAQNQDLVEDLSRVIAERRRRNAALAERASPEEEMLETANLLGRIRRFFGPG